MAIDQKYGLVNIKGVPQDEPIFILRGQDAAAAETILHYAQIAHRIGCEAEHVEHVMKSFKAIARWPHKKIPDTIIKKRTS